jgi:hypothetical protein
MQQLRLLWLEVTAGRGKSVLAIRALAMLSFAAMGAEFLLRAFHFGSLADFCGGMAVGLSAALLFIVFNLQSADFKDDKDDSRLVELKLPR